MSEADRKKDHIDLAFKARVDTDQIDSRFYYEPLFSGHPEPEDWDITFLGKKLQVPIWVSSMTGGTSIDKTINSNLARACKDFGMGMGLGSCRILLERPELIEDFAVRDLIGSNLPLYGNLGIAQVEKMISEKEIDKIDWLIDTLDIDGLIIHINPLQEWLQPEGDIIQNPPIDTISYLLEHASYPIIVKEVGQGMGIKSLEALIQLPLAAIDFAASGGTNFALLELMRHEKISHQYTPLTHIGHSAVEMVNFYNAIAQKLGNQCRCKQVIVSGGIQNFLDGYYAISLLETTAVYGQASAFLKHARNTYEELNAYVKAQVDGLNLAKAFLKIRQ